MQEDRGEGDQKTERGGGGRGEVARRRRVAARGWEGGIGGSWREAGEAQGRKKDRASRGKGKARGPGERREGQSEEGGGVEGRDRGEGREVGGG